jgi:hypothetical protein
VSAALERGDADKQCQFFNCFASARLEGRNCTMSKRATNNYVKRHHCTPMSRIVLSNCHTFALAKEGERENLTRLARLRFSFSSSLGRAIYDSGRRAKRTGEEHVGITVFCLRPPDQSTAPRSRLPLSLDLLEHFASPKTLPLPHWIADCCASRGRKKN